MNNHFLTDLIQNPTSENLLRFIRDKNTTFRPLREALTLSEEEQFSQGLLVGEIPFSLYESFIICSFKVNKPLSERSGKKAQYDLAKKILKDHQKDAGIFVFFDDHGAFRFSLVYANYLGKKQDWSAFRRFTYFVSPQLTNKTFLQRVGEGDFSSLDAIKEAFSVEKVTKDFYQEISYWYFWACQKCKFPEGAETEENGRQVSVIRLITRLIFIWFMRERNLVQGSLFEKDEISQMLTDLGDDSSSYYLAILQNLFFATLNTKQTERQFRSQVKGNKGFNPDFGNHYKYRHQSLFTNPDKMQEYFSDIPFLNGGLFDCLDIKENSLYVDGFSDVKKHQPFVPNLLFFSSEIPADFNQELGTTSKSYKVKGLFEILSTYNFTIDENTVDDKDVALDPELLGRVFENLLASFNPETSTTARKATGSYYTPREIVDYMVTESLKAYFTTHLPEIENLEEKLTQLFDPHSMNNPFDQSQSKRLVALVENVRIVDPAVGSGAFPMGALNKLVFILSKLDPQSSLWKQAQLDAVGQIPDAKLRTQMRENIENYFKEKNLDYSRKLYLIQKCIYGVDIQQIAVEIAKLRFFISLLVEESIEKDKVNWGIEPLPNLDFKIMQGNSLISEFEGIRFDLKSSQDLSLGFNFEQAAYRNLIEEFEQKKEVYQSESDHQTKRTLQKEIDQLLIKIFKQIALAQLKDYASGLAAIDRKYAAIPDPKTRAKVTAIEKQKYSKTQGIDIAAIERRLHHYATNRLNRDFFPWELYFAEVFTQKGGFDIVLGNPPYIQLQKDGGALANLYEDKGYETFTRMGDIYCLFYELGLRLLSQKGLVCLITSNKWMRAGYGWNLRQFFVNNTNPLLLLDFSGANLFESVTVDNNILLFQKGSNNNQCLALSITDEFNVTNLPTYVNANAIILNGFSSTETWVISTPIEDQIRKKIEAKGTPLREWNVNIFRGVLTGYNEAFIINRRTKESLIRQDPKSAEIIKPILRGKDIKRYQADFADLWLISTFPSLRLDIDNYPAVKRHLANYGRRLYQTGEEFIDENGNKVKTRKKTGNQWFETQDQISYFPEFNKEKIIYPNMTKYLPFYLDNLNYFTNQKCFILTGESLSFLTAFLNSKLFKFVFREKFPVLLGGTRELSKIFFEELRIMKIDQTSESTFKPLVKTIQEKLSSRLDINNDESIVNSLIYDIYELNQMERDLVNSYEI